MLVCICKGISDHAVHRAVQGGATTVDAVGRACGAGTDCGSCHEAVEEIIDELVIINESREARLARRACARNTQTACEVHGSI
jgi:bacterioferritin-associated ferredoxin